MVVRTYHQSSREKLQFSGMPSAAAFFIIRLFHGGEAARIED
jgi:hypothetical protein